MAAHAMSTVTYLSIMCLLAASSTRAAYESAGCSDEGCGIPCYMRPAADSCHYKPFSPCSNEGYDIDLENLILNLNSSLHRLENKLVQKRVIPAGETCAPLEPISNGGVIYSDLLLSPGVIAHYVCQDGYVLHGYDERECAPDGGWINSEKGTPVCRDSKVKCEPLVPIPNGHILFKSVDMTTTQPGDLVTYSCEIPYLLEGDIYRICLGNGSWSGEEPTCSLPDLTPEPAVGTPEQVTTSGKLPIISEESKQEKNKHNVVLIAIAIASGMGGLLIAMTIALIIYCIYRRHKRKMKKSESARRYEPLQMKTKLIDDTDSSTLRTALLEEESSADVMIQKPKRASRRPGQSEETETLQAARVHL